MTATFTDAAYQTGYNVSNRSCAITSSGSNRRGFVMVAWVSATTTLSTLTWDGVSVTGNLVGSIDDSDIADKHLRVYYIDNPPTTSSTVACTFSANTNECIISAVTYNGCGDNDTPPTPTQASTTAPSITVSSATGSLCLDFVFAPYPANNITAGAGQTYRVEQENWAGSDAIAAISEEAGAASVTMSHTLGTAARWLQVGVSIQEATSSPTISAGIPTGTVGTNPTLGFTTNIASGTARIVVDTAANLDAVTAAQILLGQKEDSTAAAYDSGDITVTSTSVTSTAITSLPAGTYTAAAAHSNGGNSNVITWTFTVDATAPSFSSGPALSGITASQYTVIGTSNETGTAKLIVTAIGGSQPNNAAFDALVPGVSSDAVNITAGVQFQITH